jgi:NAD(P)H-hydrate epimerase
LIREMNSGFPLATIVSVDVPSGLHAGGESVHAAYTVTLAAPKTELILPPTCERAGAITVASIGIPREFIEDESAHWLNLVEPGMFARFFAPRERGAHKGSFGHVVVIGGAQGKGGAAAMSGSAALRSGAGLVTVATDPRERATVTTLMPELMTCEWSDGVGERDVLALGPGLGSDPEAAALALDLFANASVPAVVDADALNALSTTALNATGRLRVLTPHPGEMSRLCGCGIAAVQSDRVGTARRFAAERACVVVLKGQRTVIALPDGRVFINPTGTPAMATAGSGDILTGLIAGLLAQFPHDAVDAILAAVWLHGRAGELGANQLGEQSLTAMDLLKYLPSAMRELRP